MISLKFENWKLMRSHNTHIAVLWRGKVKIKFFTHREYKTCKINCNFPGSDTLNHIINKNLCGFRFHVRSGRRDVGFRIGGDSEYMMRPKSMRKTFRFNFA